MDTSPRLCSTLKLRSRRKLSKKDLISRLPDDILLCILSFLTVKEAGRTSLLSKRWRHVWAYVPLLIFDASRISEVLVRRCVSLEVERKKFVHWVDQVVSSYKASTIDEFRLRFLLGKACSDNINNWVRFATEKRVKRLELNFGSAERGSCFPYTFPNLSSYNSLTSLQLDFVNVIGEVLERLIYNCKALEFLSVQGSRVLLSVQGFRVLVTLNVFSPSLKSLRVLSCQGLKNLEIFAPNLVSMDYYGQGNCISFKSTPKLTELYVGGISKPDLVMSPINHQIEVLKLEINGIEPFSKVFPHCKKVKTLDVSYDPECDNDLFCVCSVIKACPLLHKLVIQLDSSAGFEMDGGKWDMNREEPWCHPNLKIVEIVGFSRFALGFVCYLVKKIVSLEKLVIDPQPPFKSRIHGAVSKQQEGKKSTKAG